MTKIKEFHLADTEDGKIEVSILENPYGEGSKRVASIAIFMIAQGEEPNWKVHIPKDNIDDVIEALKEAKEKL